MANPEDRTRSLGREIMLVYIHPSPPEVTLNDPVPLHLASLFDADKQGSFLESTVESIVRRLGFDTFVLGMTTAETLRADSCFYYCTNATRERVAQYDQRSFVEIDPRIVHAWTRLTPFIWDRRIGRGDSRVEEFLEIAASWGVGSGICIPMRGDFGSHAFFAVNAPERDVTATIADTWTRALGEITILAIHFHAIFARNVIERGMAPLQRGAPLSERERCCLALAAKGRTSGAISQKLGIAERTVQFHFSNVLSKLGAANRQEAVAIAIARGLIIDL